MHNREERGLDLKKEWSSWSEHLNKEEKRCLGDFVPRIFRRKTTICFTWFNHAPKIKGHARWLFNFTSFPPSSTDYKLDTKSVTKAEDACLSNHCFACTIQMYIILQVKIQSPRLKDKLCYSHQPSPKQCAMQEPVSK